MGLNTNGSVCGTAPTLNAWKELKSPRPEFVVLSANPVGSIHAVPLLEISPMSEFGRVANVAPSSASSHPTPTVAKPEPLMRETFQTASITVNFSVGETGVTLTVPSAVITSYTAKCKTDGPPHVVLDNGSKYSSV